jgi:hypothetical protein
MQARENKSLSREIEDTMPFLSSGGHVVNRGLAVQPFDYASVYIDKDGVRVCVTGGRGEVNLSLAPSAFPGSQVQLSTILVGLGCEEYSELGQPVGLWAIDAILKARWAIIRIAVTGEENFAFQANLQR